MIFIEFSSGFHTLPKAPASFLECNFIVILVCKFEHIGIGSILNGKSAPLKGFETARPPFGQVHPLFLPA